jgi:hypothetical protein
MQSANAVQSIPQILAFYREKDPLFRPAFCFGNIPFPLAERGCSNREEYFGAA